MTKTCPNCGHEHDKKVSKCEKCKGDMSKPVKENDDNHLEEGAILEGTDLSPVVESTATLLVPKKGKVFERKMVEGHEVNVGKFAIIRPCISRGRRMRGYQPIYEASMLAENAAVFSGWPMYADHIAEELAEAFREQLAEQIGEQQMKVLEGKLREAGRSIKELGGRIVKSWYDPELVTEEDGALGYRKGGVVGEVVPQPFIFNMLEADPGSLNVSINAWPKRVRIGKASWDASQKGAVIEGIAGKPMGSVDFVYKGGAGGRPLTESLPELAVTISESAYSSDRDDRPKEPAVKKLSEMSASEIQALPKPKLLEMLKEEGGEAVAETVAEAIALSKPATPSETADALTSDALNEALAAQEKRLTEGFEKKLKEVADDGDQELREREEARGLEAVAHKDLAEAVTNGLPQAWADQLTPRYTVTSKAIGSSLKLSESDLENSEGEKLSEADAIRARVKADIAEAIKLMEASGGKPRVKGFGQSGADPQAGDEGKDAKDKKTPIVREADSDSFIGFLHESGDITGDNEKDLTVLSEMVGG